jgi:L-alanine-DL-glutamate epimerase-like enolase superfamily enzyme
MTDVTRFCAGEDGWTDSPTAGGGPATSPARWPAADAAASSKDASRVPPHQEARDLPLSVNSCRIGQLTATAYTIPTDNPEADGTIAWDTTTMVVVQAAADGVVGTGWTYGAAAIAPLIQHTLAPAVLAHPAMDTRGAWQDMVRSLRNVGRPGLGAMALSAVDNALWDLKARLLGLPLHRLLGASRSRVPVYGSGGFTTYDHDQLTAQLKGWLDQGIGAVKIKIAESWGSRVRRDLDRVEQTLEVVGPDVQVFVDANGGYTVGPAIRIGHTLDALGVTWFEEPVSSDDLTGLRDIRNATRLDVAAGEYTDSLDYAQRMCAADAVDCLQVDVTRCGGITELLRIAAVAAAHHLQISGHCSPYQHAPALAPIANLRHVEYFHDHAHIEQDYFTGTKPAHNGHLYLPETPGTGIDFINERAAPYRATAET